MRTFRDVNDEAKYTIRGRGEGKGLKKLRVAERDIVTQKGMRRAAGKPKKQTNACLSRELIRSQMGDRG